MPSWRFHVIVPAIKPVGLQGYQGFTAAPMGLEWECTLLQWLHSASPRYTHAYALTAPNGAVYGQL